jgi:tRNA (cmo5U34)-methyltransferase
MKTTNVKASQLNYHSYSAEKYDNDIVYSIPFHSEIHKLIKKELAKRFKKHDICDVLDLGVGTGLTSKSVLEVLPNSKVEAVDFSRKMLGHAKMKLGKADVKYVFGDYSKLKFKKKYDIVTLAISLHHQNDDGKRKMFTKVHSLLKKNGVFVFADLVTYRDKKMTAIGTAQHFHHLVAKASDGKTLGEWAYHQMYLNAPAALEDQLDWIKEAGFKNVRVVFKKMCTALVLAEA